MAPLFAPDLAEQTQAEGRTERAAEHTDHWIPTHHRRHPGAPQHRRAEEKGAGDEAHHQAIDGGLEPAMLQMDVEGAALDPLENLVEAAREHLAEVAPFAQHPPPFLPLRAR